MATIKAMRENARNKMMNEFIEFLQAKGEDVGMTASNEFNFPILLEDGETEDFFVVKVSIPTGSRDGEAYDGYAMRDEYAAKVVEKEERAKKAAEEKAKKIARDAKNREKLAASKALHTHA